MDRCGIWVSPAAAGSLQLADNTFPKPGNAEDVCDNRS